MCGSTCSHGAGSIATCLTMVSTRERELLKEAECNADLLSTVGVHLLPGRRLCEQLRSSAMGKWLTGSKDCRIEGLQDPQPTYQCHNISFHISSKFWICTKSTGEWILGDVHLSVLDSRMTGSIPSLLTRFVSACDRAGKPLDFDYLDAYP
jgi:hypothetical protein